MIVLSNLWSWITEYLNTFEYSQPAQSPNSTQISMANKSKLAYAIELVYANA